MPAAAQHIRLGLRRNSWAGMEREEYGQHREVGCKEAGVWEEEAMGTGCRAPLQSEGEGGRILLPDSALGKEPSLSTDRSFRPAPPARPHLSAHLC